MQLRRPSVEGGKQGNGCGGGNPGKGGGGGDGRGERVFAACSGCGLRMPVDELVRCGATGYSVCVHCVDFFVLAVRHAGYRTHGGVAPGCMVGQGLLSVQRCYGCLYQRLLDVSIARAEPVQRVFPGARAWREPAGQLGAPVVVGGGKNNEDAGTG